LWCFDGTISRAHVSAAGAKKNVVVHTPRIDEATKRA
jgi:hypothetical protein